MEAISTALSGSVWCLLLEIQLPIQAAIDVRSAEGHSHLNDQVPHFLANTWINDQDASDFKCFTST